ncbi:hypothetical protein BHE74_00048886 [Ensete ventricosum]|nr:hypothetical protein BHE74_00048886 [Ensete ventricosum]
MGRKNFPVLEVHPLYPVFRSFTLRLFFHIPTSFRVRSPIRIPRSEAHPVSSFCRVSYGDHGRFLSVHDTCSSASSRMQIEVQSGASACSHGMLFLPPALSVFFSSLLAFFPFL